jgi:thaumarchaeosortase
MGLVTIIAFCLPTIYIIISNYCGLNATIVDWAVLNGIEDAWFMPLSIEHLVLAGLFTLAILLQHGVNGLRNMVISPVFLVTIGILFMIDNIWKYGKFTPLQILVPVTATLAANVLGLMGYGTRMIFIENEEYGSLPILSVMNSQGKNASFAIAWPCSGIESLLIYTLMILLFLKNSMIPLKHRILYFVFGAVVTFFINVFRIGTIFVIALDTGANSIQVHRFHDYYGWLFSLTWIVLYPLIVIVSRDLWKKMKS